MLALSGQGEDMRTTLGIEDGLIYEVSTLTGVLDG